MKREDLIQDIIETMARCQRPANLSAWSKIGMPQAQISMLFMLSHHKILQVKQIAEYLGISQSAASQTVDSLIKKGLVSRLVDDKDRRIAYLSLTAKGQTAFRKINKLKFAGFRFRLEGLSTEELELLSGLSHKMAAVAIKN